MYRVPLRRPPAAFDRYGRPSYPVVQHKGLIESMNEDLTRGAKASGYEEVILEGIFRRVVAAVHELACGRRLDVMEIGGADGWLFDRLRASVSTYVNVEPGSIELDEAALRRLRDPAYASLSCSAEDLPLHDRSADLVVAVASIDHVPDPDRALEEARRCLRPGGYLVVTLNNRRSWWKILLGRTAYLRRREAVIAREHTVLWSLAECREHVAAHFSVVSAFSIIQLPYVPVIWKPLLPVAERIGGSLLPRFGGHSIVVGQAR